MSIFDKLKEYEPVLYPNHQLRRRRRAPIEVAALQLVLAAQSEPSALDQVGPKTNRREATA